MLGNTDRNHICRTLQLPTGSETSAHGQLATCGSTQRAQQPATYEVAQALHLDHAFPSPFFLPLQAGELASHSETRVKELQQQNVFKY